MVSPRTEMVRTRTRTDMVRLLTRTRTEMFITRTEMVRILTRARTELSWSGSWPCPTRV